MFNVTVLTDDGNEYSVDKVFKTRKAAENELKRILNQEPTYIDDGMIYEGYVSEE